ncbi:MAG: alpha/beta hydrolase [Desulfamplus sp.]|nr:alpha/beta hydrolase [Desulfamplus sp.]
MGNITILENQTIYYELIDGNSSKPYLIFLHEGLGCTEMYKDFAKQLCSKTECPALLYDRAGYGKSSPLTTKRTIHYLHDYALNELPKVVDALIPNRDFILVGHSDGASISLIFGAEKSKSLKGIITSAAHVFVEDITVDGIIKATQAFEEGKLSGLFKLHGDKTEDMFNAWSSTWLSQWFRHWNIEYLLPSITVPTLVLQGIDDQYGSTEQVNSIATKCSGVVKSVMLNGCGHSPHRDRPKFLVDIMSEFIDKVINP